MFHMFKLGLDAVGKFGPTRFSVLPVLADPVLGSGRLYSVGYPIGSSGNVN